MQLTESQAKESQAAAPFSNYVSRGVVLRDSEPQEILRWALKEFGNDIALATGFGIEGCVLVHMLAEIDPNARMFFLDTGVLFPETYELRDQLERKYGVTIERKATKLSLEA